MLDRSANHILLITAWHTLSWRNMETERDRIKDREGEGMRRMLEGLERGRLEMDRLYRRVQKATYYFI